MIGHGNGRKRRNLVIAGRSGEGPFTIRFADLRYRALPTGGLLSHDLRPGRPEDKPDGSEGKTPMWMKIISPAIIVTFLTGVAAVAYAQDATTEGQIRSSGCRR